MQTKRAVDSTAEEYWEAYFGPYGKQWVRKIPRRIATALVQRTAELKPGEVALVASAARIVPLTPGPVITEDRVFIEAAADYEQNGESVRRVFIAEFDHEGQLLSLESIAAPVSE